VRVSNSKIIGGKKLTKDEKKCLFTWGEVLKVKYVYNFEKRKTHKDRLQIWGGRGV